MFENIRFFPYHIPMPVIPAHLSDDNPPGGSQLSSFSPEAAMDPEPGLLSSGDNIRNADYYLSGKLDIFMRPPVPAEICRTLYHMEAFSIFTCEEGFFTRRRDYSSYMILYTYEGCGRLDYRGNTCYLSPHDGFFIDCLEPHFYAAEGPLWKHSVLHLNGPLLPALYRQYLKKETVLFTQPFSGSYQQALERLLHIYSMAAPFRDWQAADCLSQILTGLLAASADAGSGRSTLPENIQYLATYMENHFSMNLTLDTLSAFSGTSKYYLSREFKKYTGFSPIDYLIRLRIEHAKTLLKSTDMPANKIAHTVGIHDVNNFTNLFKKNSGMTPGEFRRV